MLYVLNSTALIAIIDGDERAKNRVQQARSSGHDVMLNAVSYYEVKRGLILPQFQRGLRTFQALTRVRGVLPLDTPALDRAANLYHHLKSTGMRLEDADILIAGIALANDATLVTHNTRHFARVRGLKLEDWET
jgi:tRNA(fMet)-specific endonuclease VapC